ncbi:conserved hypothetical protein [Candida dubliniensis CD36]|uniref:Intimal thickness related receptor IRP domain-containing protein n=1 Tax=Candida dubliniensis (strain CD36 / ATCC MYA-646 / CBS 7987 / NCPF 3949 / NRRL Y-17841) TaxID=573826 RepID=B9WMS6_CANDC|nr:conserved hypothetical protein [Candida dubliniensis CD36]CAX40392.1 conserved hypothetical protein [Candida dubliniensis CD36]
MKLFNSIILLAGVQIPLVLSKLIQNIETFELNENSPIKCFNLELIHGKTHLKLEANGVPHQQLPLNVHRNTKLLRMDKDKGDKDFRAESQSFNIYETLVDGYETQELNLYEPGQYCVSFNENKEYTATFNSKATLVENFDTIDISSEAYKHAISAIIGGLIIAGIVAKYQITGLSNISPISARIFSLLVVYFVFNSAMMILEWYCYYSPSSFSYLFVENYFKNIVGSIITCWDTYVTIMIYFGSGFKNLGYKAPSNTSWVKRIILGSLLFVSIASSSKITKTVLKRSIVLDNKLQDVFIYFDPKDSFLRNSFISTIFKWITAILGGGLLVCVTVLPFVYGYVIYNRFTRTGEYVNQQLMKNTLLYHGIYAWVIGSALYYYFDVMKLIEDYVPLVILWLIWYSERPYVALKGLEDDLGHLKGIKEFYL